MSHEVPAHRSGKAVVAAFWQRRGYFVLCEVGCDVLARRVTNGKLQFVFSEYERTIRNVLRNFERNQRQLTAGTAKFVIMVDDEKMRVAVRRLLRRYLPPASARKIGVTTIERIQQAIGRTEAS